MRIGVLLAGVFSLYCGAATAGESSAIFAGGRFWSMQPAFASVLGVTKVVAGYTGGTVENPTYQQVSAGTTGHAEAVEVSYDTDMVGYQQLLDVYWSNIDPVDAGGQFSDRGTQYRSEIFYTDEEQHRLAQKSKIERQAKLGGVKMATLISPAMVFYPAEPYHQEYAKKHSVQYNAYKYGSGRDKRLKEIWNKD